MSIHFVIKSFLENDPVSLEPYNIDKKNQVLKLLVVTAAVELVLYVDLSARKCSSFIFIVISNTISATERRYLEPCRLSMMEFFSS